MADQTLVLPSSAELDAELEEVDAEADDLDFSAAWAWGYYDDGAFIADM